MRLKVHITVILTLGLATIASAQESDASFYEKQARKDAHQEQTIIFSSTEDEKDFWKDQIRYEEELKTKNLIAYQVYMNEKREAYSKHAHSCNNQCTHSDYFYEQASIYFAYKNNKNFSKEAIGAIVQVASPRIF
ncbi:MAG: hypothetical protein GYB37_01070 [Algicola sp.]|nr:hypothetical protein [Algicola sp.]